MRDCLEGLEKRVRTMSEEPSGSAARSTSGASEKTEKGDKAMNDAARDLNKKDQDSGKEGEGKKGQQGKEGKLVDDE